MGRKDSGHLRTPGTPSPSKGGEIPKPQAEDVEEGEVYEVAEIVTTTGDVDVVEEESHFKQVKVPRSSSRR
ncbi:hypothetical protein AB205_0155610 [Aquarana catesbeiana]|uniref:Uncharacterized protein n=1 Tax=Aquarana catesbeiana TaxID=8400 RepID=A0A2G9RX03_AQUCT|nr:hypothetical protein AB205_0155610 [Aquarana catesbeiana]PIO32286.1 hypothetical protein AB205_0155610 [Aquarana catesbeiana]